MAKKAKDGKESAVAVKLIKEQAETDKAQAEREAEMVAEEAAKLKKAKKESDNQADPIAVEAPASDKDRKAAFDALLKKYEDANPVKFAAKKKRGEFDSIPDSFTGRNALQVTQ